MKLSNKQPKIINFKNVNTLVIDDDDIILKNTKHDLLKIGIQADCVSNGIDALKLIEEKNKTNNDYKIIYVDWYMDIMTGSEVIKEIRKKYGDLYKIIVISAYDTMEIEKDAKKIGADLVIGKPLFKSKLSTSITNVLEPKIEEKTNLDYSNLNILVAEDNDINWLTLSKILSFSNIVADRASNGQEAVDMVKGTKQYDLVLMDLQMPIMDGYEATKVIRSLANEEKASIPIYAMTADTFASNIKSCIDYGMNGHLAKPIELEKFMNVLKTTYNNKMENKTIIKTITLTKSNAKLIAKNKSKGKGKKS